VDNRSVHLDQSTDPEIDQRESRIRFAGNVNKLYIARTGRIP